MVKPWTWEGALAERRVRVEVEPGQVTVAVADGGPPLSPREQELAVGMAPLSAVNVIRSVGDALEYARCTGFEPPEW